MTGTDLSPYVRVIAVVNQHNADNPDRVATVHSITGDQREAQDAVRRIIDTKTAAGHRLPNLAATQTVGVVALPADLLALIGDLTHPDPCRYDHHGYCQAHTGHEQPCPHERAQALLDTARRNGLLDPPAPGERPVTIPNVMFVDGIVSHVEAGQITRELFAIIDDRPERLGTYRHHPGPPIDDHAWLRHGVIVDITGHQVEWVPPYDALYSTAY